MSDTVKDSRPVYISETKWLDNHQHTLVMGCVDPRFRIPREEFLGAHFDLARYDALNLAGGPASILLSSPIFFSVRPHIEMLHEEHAFKRVFGFAHRGCAYYRRRYPNEDDASRYVRQIADLREFRQEVARIVPGTEILLFYEEPLDEHVQFFAVE